MLYTIKHIAEILSVPALLQNPSNQIEYLITDSRRISFPSSSLFFALQTERRDGHAFIKEAYERGIKNFVVKAGINIEEFSDANFVFANDTLQALQQIAAYHRSQFKYPVIGITGSNGKTIVKEWLYQLLSNDYNIVRSPRSYNSQIGVPLSVWQMDEENNLAIFEAGISRIGEMDALENIIHPTIGILTNIGEAHADGFIGNKQKLEEKLKLFKHCKTIIAGEQYLNGSDIFNSHFEPSVTILTWGYSNKNNFIIKNISEEKNFTYLDLIFKEEEIRFTIPFTETASIENAITCCCVLLQLGISKNIIESRLKQLQAVDMRLQLLQGINNCSLINDSYSLDVSSFAISLDFLMQQQRHVAKTVILSDISTNNFELYEEVVTMLHAKNISRVITIGEKWDKHQSLLKNKIAVTQHFHNTQSFIDNFSTTQFRNEGILLKGARAFGFEKIVSLLEKKVHQTVLEINLSAIVHNLNQYRMHLNKGVKIMAMVKAFAYGSGSAEIASLLQFHKVDYLAVAYTDEGVDLRNVGIRLPIMVMNPDEVAFETIVQNNLEPELFSFSILNSFIKFLEKQGLYHYPVHIKLDTGMHRLGFEEKDIPFLSLQLSQNKYLVVKSIFSHLAASEDPAEDSFTMKQSEIFKKSCDQIRLSIGYDFIMHIANSAASSRNPLLQFDMVRLGIGLYGIDASYESPVSLHLVATLKTTIAQIREVKAGETIGYNRKGVVLKDSKIATIRIGYADGFSRRLSNGNGTVFIKGSKAPLIGVISMDMSMIDITEINNIFEGDEVEIFGKHVSVQQVAKWCETIPYEILTGINQRVKRIYIEE